MDLEIARIHFDLRSEKPILLEDPPSNYRPFMMKPSSRSFTIPVRLEMHNFPRTEILSKVFESGESWSAFKDGDYHVMALMSPAYDEPLWSMRFNLKKFDAVEVFLGKAFVTDIKGTPKVPDLFTYPLGQLLLAFVLSQKEGALVHAACIVINEKAYLFLGKSGAGKSTLSRLFRSGGHEVLNDDRVAIRKMDGEFRAFGTPWSGEAGFAQNSVKTLGGLFFITQESENKAVALTPGAAAEKIFPVTSIPWYDEETMSQILSFCEDLVLHIPAYTLYFRPGGEVVNLLEEFVSGK